MCKVQSPDKTGALPPGSRSAQTEGFLFFARIEKIRLRSGWKFLYTTGREDTRGNHIYLAFPPVALFDLAAPLWLVIFLA